MRRALVLLALLGFCNTITRAADRPECKTRPPWCLSGFVCEPTACAAESAAQLAILTAMVENAQKDKPPRLHFDVGCGVALAGVVEADLSTRIVPAPLACGGFLAFRLGRQ